MSHDTETQDGKGVADTDISPHDQTNLLKRVRSGELKVPLHMIGLRIYSPSSSNQSSDQKEIIEDPQEDSWEITAEERQQIAQEKEQQEKADFLSLGKRIHWLKCPKNPFSSHDDLGKLAKLLGKLSSADIDVIWKAIWYLEPNDKTVLTLEFQFDLPSKGLLQFVNNYSPETFLKVLTRLKHNLRALLAYRKQQEQGDDTSSSEEAEKERIDFVLRGKPFTSCFKLVGLPKSQDRVFHLIKWEKPNLLPTHCKNGYFAKAAFQRNASSALGSRILERIVLGSAIPLPKETLPGFYLVGNPYVSFSPEYFRLVGQPTTPETSEMHYPRIIPPFPAILLRTEKIASPEEKTPMTANIDPEIPANLVIFLETVGSADLTKEDDVRGLLCQISLEDLKRDLGFEMSIDQLVPFCLVDSLDNSFTVSQARNFFIFFGKGGLSVEKIAYYLKDTSVANVFAQKTAAIKKLRKFAHAGPGTEKLVTISKIFRNSALVQKLRTLDIHGTEDLIKLTSAQLIKKLLKGGTFQHSSIQNIGRKLRDNNLSLADGSEGVQNLINYEPTENTPDPNSSATAKAKPGAQTAAATDPPPLEASVAATADPPVDDPDPTSFEALFRKIGVVLDKDNEVQADISGRLTYHRTIKVHGKEYRVTVTEQTLSSAG